MKSRWILTGLVCAAGAATLLEGCRSTPERLGSMPWPPDTIRAERIAGSTYGVTTSPPSMDSRVKLVLVWPPETTFVAIVRPKGHGKPETTLVGITSSPVLDLPPIEAKRESLGGHLRSLSWVPETTMSLPRPYPSTLLLVWPPETTFVAR